MSLRQDEIARRVTHASAYSLRKVGNGARKIRFPRKHRGPSKDVSRWPENADMPLSPQFQRSSILLSRVCLRRFAERLPALT